MRALGQEVVDGEVTKVGAEEGRGVIVGGK